MDHAKKAQQKLSDSAAMKKMVELAAKLYADCPHLYEGSKAQSFLLTTAGNPDSGVKLPSLPQFQGLLPQQSSTGKISEMTPKLIQQELEDLQREYDKEVKRRQKLTDDKQSKLKDYIHKEQEYRERIEEYNKKIK